MQKLDERLHAFGRDTNLVRRDEPLDEPTDDRQQPHDGLSNVGRSRPNARHMPYLDGIHKRHGHWNHPHRMRRHGHLDATAAANNWNGWMMNGQMMGS